MAKVTRHTIEDAIPAMVKAAEGLENGVILLTIHQGEITKVQGLPGLPERTVQRPTGTPKK